MALCVSTRGVNPQYLIIANPPPADLTNCSGSVLLSPTEYLTYVSYSSMPSSAELAQAFEAGFMLPMAGYMIAYLIGRLPKMFSD